MPETFDFPSPTQPLSVGNVVSAAAQLYRSHIKQYSILALRAYAWSIVPIYGWARCAALLALISRLAFGELVNQPEPVASGERFVNSRKWQFLITYILMLLIGIGVVFSFGVIFAILVVVSTPILKGLDTTNLVNIMIMTLLSIVIIVILGVALSMFFTRFYLIEIPLAIEDEVNGTRTISRSWELTKGHIWRIMAISFVSFLIILPVEMAFQLIITFIQIIFTPLMRENNTLYILLVYLPILILSFAISALIEPFFRVIRAVIYYDLRSRREGLGLELRNYEL